MSADVRRATIIFFIKLIAICVVLGTSRAAEYTDSLTVSETKPAPSDINTASRHKRAPGWGKRAPGWGKRAPGWGKRAPGWGKRNNNELFDQPEHVIDSLNRVYALKSNPYFPEDVSFSEQNKRAPGWGKRSCDNDAYPTTWLTDRGNAIPHWRKRIGGLKQDDEVIDIERRAPGWGKRTPGWGKRNYEEGLSLNNADTDARFDNWDDNSFTDQQLYENSEILKEPMISYTVLPGRTLLSQDLFSVEGKTHGWRGKLAPGWAEKRAPGWGKRNYQSDIDDEDAPTEKRAPGWGKRAPGWGKRAPGWGKRNYHIDVVAEDAPTEKRAPGWGKRAPGWGKRSFETELDDDSTDKRAPGWGKRAARAKRSLTSINVSTKDNCNQLHLLESAYIARIQELAARRSTECGNTNEANKLLERVAK